MVNIWARCYTEKCWFARGPVLELSVTILHFTEQIVATEHPVPVLICTHYIHLNTLRHERYAVDAASLALRRRRCVVNATLQTLHRKRRRCVASTTLQTLRRKRYATDGAWRALRCRRCVASVTLQELRRERYNAGAALRALYCKRGNNTQNTLLDLDFGVKVYRIHFCGKNTLFTGF